MRRLFTFSAILAVAFLLACSGPGEGPGPDPIEVTWGADVPQSKELAGIEVMEETEGPWTLRRASGGSSGRGKTLGDSWGADSAPMESMAAPPAGDAESHDGGSAGAYGGRTAEPAKSSAPSPVVPPVTGAPRSEGGLARPSPDQGGAPLKAGTTDDNEDYEEFLKFLATWGDRQDTAGLYDEIDVAARTFIRVVNEAGKPVPAALVKVVDVTADKIALAGTTYGDGRVPFYPYLETEWSELTDAEGPSYLVEVMHGAARKQVEWDGGEDLEVVLDVAKPIADTVALDVLFLIDTTGSMGDEIGRIKASLLGMTQKLRSMEREFDLRYAAVLYRDVGDAYVTKAHPFTGDIKAFDGALATIVANGGGDGPESLNQGLAEAVGRADWREGAAKVMFLIADASPHMDYAGDVPYGESLKAALADGIRIHSVAASGIDPVGSLAFRQIAQFTRGKFIFIEYGSDVVKSGESHGVKYQGKSNNLDDILFEQIREEVATWGRF